MNIKIEELPKGMKNDVIMIGGEPNFYSDYYKGFTATFSHHKLITQGDQVTVIDDLTGAKLVISRSDFYMIELL